MSGLLVGILLARAFSGLIAEAASWRTVYVVGRRRARDITVVLARRIPGEGNRAHLDYGELLGSVVQLMRTEPVLRLRSAIGALAFATFNVIWTSLAFLLVASPYHYSEAVIGLFGLSGRPGRWPPLQRPPGRPGPRALGHRRIAGPHRGLRPCCRSDRPACGP